MPGKGMIARSGPPSGARTASAVAATTARPGLGQSFPKATGRQIQPWTAVMACSGSFSSRVWKRYS